MRLLRLASLLATFALVEGCGEDEERNPAGTPAPDPAALERLTMGDALYQLDESSGDLQPSILLLRPAGGAVLLPVGTCEFEVIYTKLHTPFFRPLPHDLFKSLAELLDMSVPRIVLDMAQADSLSAHIVVQSAQGDVEMPVSVGDAVAIAQRMSAEIMGTQRRGRPGRAGGSADPRPPDSAATVRGRPRGVPGCLCGAVMEKVLVTGHFLGAGISFIADMIFSPGNGHPILHA